jgi:hypothetical protein
MDGVIMAVTAIYLFYQSIPSLRNKIALGGLLLLCFCQSLNQMVAMLIDNIYFYWFQIVIYMVGVAELLLWTYENWSDVREWFINKIISFKRWLDGL